MASGNQKLELLLLALPNQASNSKDAQQTLDDLKAFSGKMGAKHWALPNIPLQQMRVGTIDSLLALTEEMQRIDTFNKSLVQKLYRTYTELEESEQELTVYDKTIKGYITDFSWDDGHLNPRTRIKDLVQHVHTSVQKTAEKLRSGAGKLGDIQSSLQAIERKKTASLMNKNMREYVAAKNWKNGDYIRSAIVVVPSNKVSDFLEKYEFLEDSEANDKMERQMQQRHLQHQDALKKAREKEARRRQMVEESAIHEAGEDEKHEVEDAEAEAAPPAGPVNIWAEKQTRTIVPNSAIELARDGEFVAFQVHLLRRGYDWFKQVCREIGAVVRDFELDDVEAEDEEKTVAELTQQETAQKKKMQIYCRSTFAETFSRFVHLKIIRVFVEAVLRFGLPIDFTISVIEPQRGTERKLLQLLDVKYEHLAGKFMQSGDEDGVDFSGLRTDFHPYVLFPVRVDFTK